MNGQGRDPNTFGGHCLEKSMALQTQSQRKIVICMLNYCKHAIHVSSLIENKLSPFSGRKTPALCCAAHATALVKSDSKTLYAFCAQFLPCDAMRCTVVVIVILSVCLSHSLVDCVHTVRLSIMISLPHGSPIILVSGDITFILKFEGGHPERGR